MKRILFALFLLIPFAILNQAVAQLQPFNLPVGSYEQSCWACTIDSGQLNCICNNRNGKPMATNLGVPLDCQYIENINGQLVCTQFKGHHHGYSRHYYDAGTIVNRFDATATCPTVCRTLALRWTGRWRKASDFGFNAQCQCLR